MSAADQPVSRAKGNTIVSVKVTPGARRERVSWTAADTVVIAVKEPAARNMANRRVQTILSLHYQVPVTSIRMLTGARSGTKRFVIQAV